MAPPQQRRKVAEPKKLSVDIENETGKARKEPRSSKRDKFALRAQAKIACAECRRLKIKCDRTIPCTTCVKRGCASLCPNGTIPPGDGSRFVLAATDHLTSKASKMEARMRSLEDALAIAHNSKVHGQHPLLAISLADDPELYEEPTLNPVLPDEGSQQHSIAKALGTFHIEGDDGFNASTSAAETILDDARRYAALNDPVSLPDLDPSYLGPEINLYAKFFPFPASGLPTSSTKGAIETFLPPVDRGIFLCDTFFENLSWMTSIVSRDFMVDNLIPRVYKLSPGSYGAHDLALVLITFGIGSLVNLEDQPYNLEAQHYCMLGRAALGLQSVLTEPSLATVKALHLLSIYYGLSGKEGNMEQSYTLLDLAGQVALRVGMHVDPARFKFSADESYERREYFWNLLAGLLWTSLVTGRPPTALAIHIDCRIPTLEEEQNFCKGELPRGCTWGFQACLEGLLPVTKATLAVKPPDYSTVLDLDKKIRAMAISPVGSSRADGDTSMRSYAHSNYLDQILLFLHRPFFAQAMTDFPSSPTESPYYESVVSGYRAACVVLQTTNDQYVKKPALCVRIWRMWSFAFTAAIVVGTLAMRGITLNLDSDPKEQFEAACVMFRSAAEQGGRAAQALPLLEHMLQKAYQASSDRMPRTSTLSHAFVDPGSLQSSSPPSSSRSYSAPLDALTHHTTSSASQQPSTSFTSGQDGSDPFMSSFGDIAWQGLFRESSGNSSYGYRGDMGTLNDAAMNSGLGGDMPMLDDSWNRFMHTYQPHHPLFGTQM